jgi:hypothetical protein
VAIGGAISFLLRSGHLALPKLKVPMDKWMQEIEDNKDYECCQKSRRFPSTGSSISFTHPWWRHDSDTV